MWIDERVCVEEEEMRDKKNIIEGMMCVYKYICEKGK